MIDTKTNKQRPDPVGPNKQRPDPVGPPLARPWDEKEIVYYWDGREISRKPNTHARRPGPVIFSTAVLAWAGTAGASLADSSMDVDWVWVWKRADVPAEARP